MPRGQQGNIPATEAVAISGDADGTIVSREPGTYASQKGRRVGDRIGDHIGDRIGDAIGKGTVTPLAQQARNAARGSSIGDAVGKGTPLAQQARNAAKRGKRVHCPATVLPLQRLHL